MDTLRYYLFANAMISSVVFLNGRHVPGHVETCLASCPTIRKVESCPVTEEEWREKEKLLACDKRVQNCSKPENFRYHCMMDEKEEIIEFCATMVCIRGQVCPVFDRGGVLVQELFSRECSNCTIQYPSSDLFKYPQCYSNASTPMVTNRDTKTTVSSQTTKTTVSNQTTHFNEDVKNVSSRIQKSIKSVDEFDVFKIPPIAFGVCAITIVVALVVWRYFKHNKASKRLKKNEGSNLSGEKEKFVISPTSDDN